MLAPLITGFTLGGSLIIAIGAQNAFILRQGLLGQHVFVLCLICALSDALLIAAGVAGVGVFIERSPLLLAAIRLGGAGFLFWYAWVAFQRSRNPETMEASGREAGSLKAAIATCLAFTFLNPHVYLDTVLLVGGLSAGFEGNARLVYAIGAMSASFVWFFGLGYGARLLVPVFANPRAWQILDVLIAAIMLLLAVLLLKPLFAG
ncbi:MAG: amino acid transporter [Rhizobiaceae bacterium]|jgi:L-lysine exporter family protein LysE/ArgO|nr:amino acid transporter [Rhizobiaceae bacterium]